MNVINGTNLLIWIRKNQMSFEVAPVAQEHTLEDIDSYELICRNEAQELGRIGVWKTADGGVKGRGGPEVVVENLRVRVLPGDRMGGGLEIRCSSSADANSVAEFLSDHSSAAYSSIEVDAAVPGT